MNRFLRARCADADATPRATVRVRGPHRFHRTLHLHVCRLLDGTTIRKRVDLLDPGEYRVVVRAGAHRGAATFTVEPDTTVNVPVTMKRMIG